MTWPGLSNEEPGARARVPRLLVLQLLVPGTRGYVLVRLPLATRLRHLRAAILGRNGIMLRPPIGALVATTTIALGFGWTGGVVEAADVFEGKRITFTHGGTAGAGLDAYVRTVARHFGRHVPGQPTTIVQNMPGAGTYKAAEYMETLAPKDGTTIGSVFPGAIMAPLLDEQKPRFDPAKFIYLGTAETGARVCSVFHTSQIRSYEDARAMKSIMPASQAGGSSRDYTLLTNALAGTRMQMVSGYTGGADMFLAVERGEVEGLCGFDWSTIKAARGDWLRDGKLRVIIQYGLTTEPELDRLGVPPFNKHVAEADRPVADLVVAQQIFSRMFFVPAGTPSDRVEILRKAFLATMTDKEFLAEAEKSQLNVVPMSGEQVGEVVRKIYATSPDIVARARAVLKQ